MSRHKAGTKSGWRKRDKKYRLEQNNRARRNRQRKVVNFLVDITGGPGKFRAITSEAETSAILADPDTMAALAEAEAEHVGQVWDEDLQMWVTEIEMTEAFS